MPRLISCYSNCFGSSGVYAAAERIGKTGIHNLELALRGHNFGGLVIPESAVITEKATDNEVRAFLAHLEKHEVKVTGCNVGGANILTVEGVELTIRRIQFARKWFGVPIVISGAGQPSNPAERATAICHLRQIGDRAEQLGMIVALETHKGPTQNAEAMLRLMDELDHPAVLLNFDTGNIAYYTQGVDPVDELEKVKHLVKNVHVKDNRGRFEDWYFPALGEGGSVDFKRIRQTLDGVCYQGPFTIEIEGIQNEPEPGLEGRVRRITRSVEHLKACGYFD